MSDERRSNLLKEVYGDLSSPKPQPPAEVKELMKVFDWTDEEIEPALDFDKLDLFYESEN
jgi:hypothetical protein